MKPWREVAVPHRDVLEGTFQQSEFAADITAVHNGKATPEYQDAVAFFQRTFITEGMRLLIGSVALRLNGRGGDPVIQLQTAFGGGKTHTLLAIYHLATRTCPLKDLAGVSSLLDQQGIDNIPQSRIVVLDGTALSPGQPWKHGALSIHTLWGELAYQLNGESGYDYIKEADNNGTSPGKDALVRMIKDAAPCVILVDELVAYIRQFGDGQVLSGGTYDTNLSFVQALTEAIKLVPNAILLASLPESEIEAGSSRGKSVLKALEKTFGRVQALWKPVATEEAFEIVRRRLFEPINSLQERDAVCRAFAYTYIAEGNKLPGETQESRYFDRLIQAYPIHPEVFDRLYEDWTTLDGFQRTRGVLKLMAKVIFRLWKDQNHDLMIMPGNLPLYDGSSRNELTYYLQPGWDAVLERDIDGDRSETAELENREPRFGAFSAARKVARTIFLGSAPASSMSGKGIKGIDKARVLLGCLQPEQTSSTYTDALSRLADRLHYLNTSGDKTQQSTRFWFDTRANLRREMEDRKGRFEDKNEVKGKISDVLKRFMIGSSLFESHHIFTPHSDVPDDTTLRLIILSTDKFYSKQENRVAFEEVTTYIRNNGQKPRYRGNRLIFIAAEHSAISRINDSARTVLAWNSIVEDIKDGRLNIDRLQEQQAKKELQIAEEVLPKAVRECYKWLLCPVQNNPTDRDISVEAYPLNITGSSFMQEIDRICVENELIISTWSPIHLRQKLKDLYWKNDRLSVSAMTFWDDTTKYLYLPRLKGMGTLEQAIIKGAGSREFFGTAYSKIGENYEGFKLGDANVQLDDTLLLIEPTEAARYETTMVKPSQSPVQTPGEDVQPILPVNPTSQVGHVNTGVPPITPPKLQPCSFYGSVEISPSAAKMRLQQIAEEIINLLSRDPNASVKIALEINAEFPEGVTDQTRRAVSENAGSLGFKVKEWE